MRTIKFLGIAAAMAVVAVTANAQGGPPAGAFPGLDEYARLQARQMIQTRGASPHAQGWRRAHAGGRFAKAGLRGERGMGRFAAGPGVRAGFRAGFRAGIHADATPAQQAFAKQLAEQRQSVRAQVIDGKLTREQARAQMQKWIAEHRPKQ